MLDHLADLESDFSRFHRIDDIYAMPGPKFMRFAYRIAAYDGMLTRRIELQNEKPAPAPASPPAERRPPARGGSAERPVIAHGTQGARLVPLAAMALADPGLFERVQVNPDSPSE